MGLDFSHSDAHWSYSGFMHFRTRLADEVGIDLSRMDGFDGIERWDGIEDDIVPFLNHSDCDGTLSPEQCKTIAPRIEQLIAKWDDGDYDKQHAERLLEGMNLAAKLNETLVFC